MGSKTLDLDPVRHDELVAWVSHLPQFMATALSALLEDEVGDAPELKDVGGRALREMTRLGASPFSMWRDIAYTNTEAVARALEALEQRLAHLRENLRTPELRDEFEQANRFRQKIKCAHQGEIFPRGDSRIYIASAASCYRFRDPQILVGLLVKISKSLGRNKNADFA